MSTVPTAETSDQCRSHKLKKKKKKEKGKPLLWVLPIEKNTKKGGDSGLCWNN